MNRILIIVVATIIALNGYAQAKPAKTTATPTEAPVAPAPAPKKVKVYSPAPANANPFEIGIGGGLHMVVGDINSNVKFNLDNSTFGLHVRKGFTHAFSMRFQYYYGQATMRSNAPRFSAIQDISNPTPAFGNDTWFASSRAYSHAISLDQIVTIGNSNLYKGRAKWTIDLFAGPALVMYKTKLDAFGNNGGASGRYTTAFAAFKNNIDAQYADGGSRAKNEAGKVLDNVFDGVYETDARKGSQGPISGFSMTPAVTFGFSINRAIGSKFSASFESRGYYLMDDNIDGTRWSSFSKASSPSSSQSNDMIWNSTLKLNYFIGKTGATPLYWKNSNEEMNKKLASMNPKKELNAAMMDDDADGVPNILDQEPGSKEGFPVDTKGIMLDSDKDGILDGDDKEPYSPGGVPVDANGIAKVAAPACCAEIENMKKAMTSAATTTVSPACAEVALPTVKFDKSKFGITSNMIGSLKMIGDKMQGCPDMKLVVNGINDKNTNNGKLNEQLSYNRAMEVTNYLSEKFGVSRDRFIVRYNLEGVGDQEADRAVMFRNAQDGESGANNPPSPHPGLKAGSK